MEPLVQLKGHSDCVTTVRFSPSGNLLASASRDACVRIYKLTAQSGKWNHVLTLDGVHNEGINEISWSPDDRLVHSVSDDQSLVTWDIEKRMPIRCDRGHTGAVMTCAAPTSLHTQIQNVVVSGGADEQVMFWDLRADQPISRIHAHSETVTSIDIDSTGTTVASAALDGLCRIWDLRSHGCTGVISSDALSPIGSCKFSPNGRFILVSMFDSTLRLFDAKTCSFVEPFCFSFYLGHVSSRFPCQSHLSVRLAVL